MISMVDRVIRVPCFDNEWTLILVLISLCLVPYLLSQSPTNVDTLTCNSIEAIYTTQLLNPARSFKAHLQAIVYIHNSTVFRHTVAL